MQTQSQCSDAPRVRLRVDEASAFARKWSEVFRGESNAAKTRQLAWYVGHDMKMNDKECGRLATLLAPFFAEGYNPKTIFRAGLFTCANYERLTEGVDMTQLIAETWRGQFWAVVQVTDLIEAERTKKGRRRWLMVCLILAGPLAGREVTVTIMDGYLSGVVRSISSARYSKTIAGMDAFGMRFMAKLENKGGALSIEEIKDDWAAGKKFNSELRRQREGCPKGPCERCPHTTETCPYAIRKRKKE